jgi:hypothetical protein
VRSSTVTAPPQNEVLDPLGISHDPTELMRFLGYGTAKTKHRIPPDEVMRICEAGQSFLTPKASYAVYPAVYEGSRDLVLGNVTIHGKVATFLAQSEQIAVFVVTAGGAISERARAAASAGKVLEAWALDALGSYAAEATADALSRYLEQRIGVSGATSQRYSPGYCGMAIGEQSALFRLVDASSIGVSLSESMLMQPLKSISGILGIGQPGAFGAAGSPCELCQLKNCPMRR